MKSIIKNLLVALCRRVGETRGILIDWRDISDLKAASDLLATMRTSKWLKTEVINAPQNQKILVLAPHPDDEIIGPGGTLLQAIEHNCSVKVIIFSNDAHDKKSDPEIDAVAKAAGFAVRELGFQILKLPDDCAAYETLRQTIEQEQPDHIFLPFMLDDHPDHRQVSKILLDLFSGHTIPACEIWAYQVYGALPLNAAVNIGRVIERKLDILRLYKSRFKTRDWAHYTRGLNAFNIRFLDHPTNSDYAEIFLKTSMRNYLALCRSYFPG